jgi:hypothetical protein
MTTGNLEKPFALGDRISDNRYQEARAEALRKLSEKICAARSSAADNSLGWRYKFGPLPNNYCVLQDVAVWSRNHPAMNFISVTPAPEGGRYISCRINDGLSKFYD